jgi:peptidoglycan/LPS O-acetylase OafA/YrhL
VTTSDTQPKASLWASARQLAGRTPPERNRYVDFLRALSILAVVVGHWVIAAPHVAGGRPVLGHMLDIEPWTHWLTWGFQVMPVFFMVGGFSNAASWSAALREDRSYSAWLAARLQRLLGPLMPLLLFWTALGVMGRLAGVSPPMIKIGSQAALVPIWFLAVYILVALLVPVTYHAWDRWGMGSFWLLAGAAVLVDLAAFAGGFGVVRWTNYLFIWLAVHQMGYAWRSGWFTGARRALPWAVGGLIVLAGLVTLAGYPRSMVGVPGEEVSNTLPPTLAMLALGCLQGGALLSLEAPLRRWLARPAAWTATVLVNGMIMTVYLWHLTAMVLVIALGILLDGPGLGLAPGSPTWWVTRPLWMALLGVALIPFVAVFGRLERAAGRPAAAAAWRLVLGSTMVCGGLALLALDGIGADGPLGIRWGVVLLALVGAALANVRPLPRRTPAR